MGGGKRRVETKRAVVEHLDNDNKRILNQMMLRFRPIAPRPVSVENSVVLPVKEKRVKRKYVRVKNNNNNNNNKISEECNYYINYTSNYTSLDRTVAIMGSEFVTNRLWRVPEWISFDVSENNNNNNNNSNSNSNSNSKSSSRMSGWIPPSLGLHGADLATVVKRRQSWITVESVIGSCEDWGRGLGYTDLEMDNCPGFISNGFDEVQWVNLAYRRMVDPSHDDGAPPPEVSVWLIIKVEKIDFVYWPAFSCRVRVVYDLFEKKKQMTVPCDVWKMDSGGYAWRLDVEAALSLGRLN